MRVAYACPLHEAVFYVHGWARGPLMGLAEGVLAAHLQPRVTWLRQALRYRVRVSR